MRTGLAFMGRGSAIWTLSCDSDAISASMGIIWIVDGAFLVQGLFHLARVLIRLGESTALRLKYV